MTRTCAPEKAGPRSRRAIRRERGQVHASSRAAANGSVTRTRNSIRNSESPKLYSKSPAASIARHGGQRRGGRRFVRLRSGTDGQCRDEQRDHEPQPGKRRRHAALRGDLQRHVVEVRVDGIDGVVGPIVRVDARNHVRADTGQRMVLMIRAPISIIASAILVGRILHVEDRHHAPGDRVRREREQDRDDHGQERR